MKKYETPELEVLHLDDEDIVTASTPTNKAENEMDIFSTKDIDLVRN